MQYKFARNITRDFADVYLYDEIGYDPNTYTGLSGQHFAQELDYLANYEGVKRINVRINSPGGKIIDGYSIVSAILNINQNKKGVWVDTYIDGMAASVAGWIAVTGKVVYMAEYGLLMMHNPSYQDKLFLTEKDKEVLQKFKNTIVNIFQSRTGMAEEELSKMMDNETWMDASEAINLGFADKIISVGSNKPVMVENKKPSELYQVFNSILNKSSVNMELNTEIAASLGVNNVGDAVKAISEQKAKIKAFETENTNLQNILHDLNAQIEKYKSKEQELVKQQSTELVENAIREQRINASEKQTWIDLAVANYEGTKKALNSIQPVKISKLIETAKNTDERDNWTYKEWAKKDPKGLEKLKTENIELFNQITNNI